MGRWSYICAVLCLVGFFKELRPNKPFLTKFLTEYKNFTDDQVVQEIYPIATYTHLLTLPVIFLITDFLRYKPIIIFEIASFVSCFCILTWANGLTAMKIFEVLYGSAGSAEIAYYTYIYAKVDKIHYKKVTSFVHTAIILGNLGSALSSQALISTNIVDYGGLNYLTISFCAIALVISLFMPNVGNSLYFHRNISQEQKIPAADTAYKVSIIERTRIIYALLLKNSKYAFTKLKVLDWPLWVAFISVGSYQVKNYAQSLWESIINDTNEEPYHGAVEATHTLLSVVLTIIFGHFPLPCWPHYGGIFLSLSSAMLGSLLLWLAFTRKLFLSYIAYIAYRVVFQLMFTISSAGIAERVSQDSLGLIFGMNRFISISIQTIMTFLITDKNGLSLDESYQFKIYGAYYFVLVMVFTLATIVSTISDRLKSQSKLELVDNSINNSSI